MSKIFLFNLRDETRHGVTDTFVLHPSLRIGVIEKFMSVFVGRAKTTAVSARVKVFAYER
jgi:hypothetical protein